MTLTAADIKSLTGYVQHAAQIRWLQAHGWRFTVSGLGAPKVAVAEFNRHMVGGRAAKQEPDYSALHG